MAVMQRKFSHDYSDLTKYTLFSRTISKIGGTTENNAACCKEITNHFYSELKEILNTINSNDFVFDDNEQTMTIWGRTYGIVCCMYSTSAQGLTIGNSSGSANAIAPFIFSQTSISATKCFRWMGYSTNSISAANINTYTIPGAGANTSMLTSPTDKTNTLYTIKVYYNTNFYSIQYISAFGEVINLLTVIKGYITDNPTVNVIYECAGPNNNYFENSDITSHLSNLVQGSVYGVVPQPNNSNTWNCGYHQMYRMDTGDTILPLPTSAGIPGGSNNLPYFGLQHAYMLLGKCNITEFGTTSDAIITQPLCLGGLITFDNMLLGDGTLNLNSFYNINGETYYCSGDDIQKSNESTFDRLILYPRFLLKM